MIIVISVIKCNIHLDIVTTPFPPLHLSSGISNTRLLEQIISPFNTHSPRLPLVMETFQVYFSITRNLRNAINHPLARQITM